MFEAISEFSSVQVASAPSSSGSKASSQARTKADIMVDLKANPNDDRYEFIKPENRRNDAWENFLLIRFEGNPVGFVKCIWCNNILTYNSKTGTASLLRHKCNLINTYASVKIEEQQLENEPEPEFEQFTEPILYGAIKEQVVKKQLRFSTKDLRPLNVTEGTGFMEFAQELINLGAEYGRQNIQDILLSQNILTQTLIPEEYQHIKSQLINVVKTNSIALSVDCWKDERTQRTFLTVTAHLINDNMDLLKYVLGTREFQTETNIQKVLGSILKEYECERKLSKSVIVTENDSIMLGALRPFTRISCAGHTLNSVIQDILGTEEPIPELKTVIAECKRLVNFVNVFDLNSKLSTPLKKQGSTQWSSVFSMLKSILEVFEEIQTLLEETNDVARLERINLTILDSLVNFLNLFKACAESLSSHTKPTLNEFVLWEQKLLKHCGAQPEDSALILELKTQTLNSLKKHFIPQGLHYVALFLNPNFKSMKFLDEEKRKSIKNSVAMMLRRIDEEIHDEDLLAPTPSKRARIEEVESPTIQLTLSLFGDLQDFSERGDAVETEMRIYSQKRVSSNTDILRFWKENTDLPLLKKLARRVLNIPASSGAKHRMFSSEAKILEERRSMLTSDDLDKLLFLHANNDL